MRIYGQDDRKNIIGENVRRMRKMQKLTQKDLAAKIQTLGLDMDRLAVVRIEAGTRVVADYEVKVLKEALGTTLEELYK